MFTHKFGIEVEFTGITREKAAGAAASYLGATAVYTGGYYESRILTINLFDVLRDWKQKKDLLALQVNTITDFFLKQVVIF